MPKCHDFSSIFKFHGFSMLGNLFQPFPEPVGTLQLTKKVILDLNARLCPKLVLLDIFTMFRL